MNASVDKLFEDGEVPKGEGFALRAAAGHPSLPTVHETSPLPSAAAPQNKPPNAGTGSSMSKNNETALKANPASPSPREATIRAAGDGSDVRDSSSELYREYQKQRQRVQDELAEMEKQRLTYQNQLQQQTTDNRIVDEKSSRMKSESEHISKGWTR